MAANLFGRYVWLIDTLHRHERLTFQEINSLWKNSGLGYGEELSVRTFHNHQKAIRDIFDVYIECDRKGGYQYFIDEPERLQGSNLRSWLVSSYATLNQIHADNKLEERIIFENIPSGNTWLTFIAEAMRNNHVLSITHQGFSKTEPSTFDIEPYFLKVVKRRWYVVARSPYYSEQNKAMNIEPHDVFRVYALDRILDIEDTGETFEMKKTFDPNKFFEGCCGVITADEQPMVHVVARAYGGFANFLRTLPLHESQRELANDEKGTLFEYHVKLTLDFYQLVLAQGDQMEIVEPKEARKTLRDFARNMLKYYSSDDDENESAPTPD